MGVVIKQSIKSSLISYLGIALGFVNTILLFPKMLSLEEIGLFKLLLSICIILMPLLQFNGSTVVTKFFSYFKEDQHQLNSFISFILILPAVGFALFAAVSFFWEDGIYAFLFKQNSPLFITYTWALFPLVVFFVFSNLLEGIIFSNLKSVFVTFLKTVLVRVLTTAIVLLYFFNMIDQWWLIAAFVAIYAIQCFILFVYFLILSKYQFVSPFVFMRGEHFSEVKKYMALIFVGGSGAVIVTQIDSIMAASKLGLKQTGIYTIAFFMAVVIEIPRRNIIQILAPLLTDAVKNNNQPEILSIYKKTAINQFIVSGLVFSLIAVSLQDIYNFIPTKENYTDVIQGMPVFILVGLSYVFDMLMGCNSEIIHFSKLYKWNAILIPVLAFLTIGLNLLFLDFMQDGLIAIALATLTTIVTHNLIRCLIIVRYFKAWPFSLGHLKFLLVLILALFIGWTLPDLHNKYFNILLNGTVVGGLMLFTTYKWGISAEFNATMNHVLKRLKLRK